MRERVEEPSDVDDGRRIKRVEEDLTAISEETCWKKESR